MSQNDIANILWFVAVELLYHGRTGKENRISIQR